MLSAKDCAIRKFEATGNDFLVMTQDHFFASSGEASYWAQQLCDRKLGPGADGVLVVDRLDESSARMVILNADGSRPEMCGNGVRCVAAFFETLEPGLTTGGFTVVSDAGPRMVERLVSEGELTSHYRVKMGEPRFLSEVTIRFGGRDIVLYQVNMGNPHAISFESELFNDEDLWHLGRLLNEQHRDFPQGVNLEIVHLESGHDPLLTRVYERGVGETDACGTGACAVAVAAIKQKILNNQEVNVALPGGVLKIDWCEGASEDGREVMMTGPAHFVGEVRLSDEWIARRKSARR